jgi:hypothetical protein
MPMCPDLDVRLLLNATVPNQMIKVCRVSRLDLYR